MAYLPLPDQYRKTPPLIFNIDYFDFIANAGYKKFYLGGLKDSVGDKYILTNDSTLISDSLTNILDGTSDIDFDIVFDNPVTIAAAEAAISYTVRSSGNAGTTFTIVWTVYHVTALGAETSLGTVTDPTTTGTGANFWHRRSVKVLLTSKRLNKGEKLRINGVATAAGAGNSFRYYIDPSGLTVTGGAEGGASSIADINVPFVLDL